MWEALHDHPCNALRVALNKVSNAGEEELEGLFDPSQWTWIHSPPGVGFWHTMELTLSVYDAHCVPAAIELGALERHKEGQIYNGAIDRICNLPALCCYIIDFCCRGNGNWSF